MFEVEVKVRANHESVSQRLTGLESEHLETVTQEDTYYDAPDRDFANTDEALRIRQETADEESQTRLTYKGPLVDSESKTRQEAETEVTDQQAMRSILSGLGYDPAATVRKERDRYAVEDCTVTLDAIDGLGEFVEVEYEPESVATEADIDAARERVVAVLADLGLEETDQIRTSYLGLLLEDE